MGDLTKNFSRSEFACKCGCGFDSIDPRIVILLQGIRDSIGKPIRIASGCRCEDRNEAVGGVRHSEHTLGMAADVMVEDSITRYAILSGALQAGVRRIGIYPTFVHLGVSPNHPQRVCWISKEGDN